jgi:hypothetical protein
MLAMLIWGLGLAVSLAIILIATASATHSTQLIAALVIVTAIAASGVRDQMARPYPARSDLAMARTTVRYLGLLWSWSLLAIATIYSFLLHWPKYMIVVGVATIGALTCLSLGIILEREAKSEKPDQGMVQISWLGIKVQLAVAALGIGGLMGAGRLAPDAFGGADKWAAINILVAASVGIVALTANALYVMSKSAIAAANKTVRSRA